MAKVRLNDQILFPAPIIPYPISYISFYRARYTKGNVMTKYTNYSVGDPLQKQERKDIAEALSIGLGFAVAATFVIAITTSIMGWIG